MTPPLKLALLVLAAVQVAGQQAPPATGAISGVVVDATTQRPIAGAIVIVGMALPAPVASPVGPAGFVSISARRQLTDDLGRFVFTDLPGGEFNLSASRPGYFEGAYGRRGLGGINNQPRRIALTTGQWFKDARLELLKPASISGTIRTDAGEPLVGVLVRAYSDVFIGGARQLISAQSATTDDRGEYRFFELTSGRYVIAVPSTQHAAPADLVPQPPPASADALNRGTGIRGYPAIAFDPVHRLMLGFDGPPLPPPAGGRRQVYPLTFHPSARAISDTAAIDVVAGDEKSSIDIQLRAVPAVRVSGRLDGAPDAVSGMTLRLMSGGTENLGRGIEQATAVVSADGNFTFLNVPAGPYVLIASRVVSQYTYLGSMGAGSPAGGRGTLSSTAAHGAPPGTMLTRSFMVGSAKYQGRLAVAVGGQDLAGVLVPMQSGVSISGRVVYDTNNPNMAPFSWITAEPADGNLETGPSRYVRDADDEGTYFILDSVLPGSHMIRTINAGLLKSITWSERDYTDTPLEVAAGKNITGVVITITDKTTTISGSITDATGQPATTAGVVVFPAERAQWRNFGSQPRRIRYIPASTAGVFGLRNLPPGDYFAVAIDDSHSDRWHDPAFLESAARVASRFSLDWGAGTVVDLKLQIIK